MNGAPGFSLFEPVASPARVKMQAVRVSYGNGGFSLFVENLALEPGRIHCIYGTNGCGKTTLLRLLSGLVPLRGGRLSWENVSAPAIPGKEFVFVTQADPWPHWNVWRNIQEPQELNGIPSDVASARTRRVVEILGLIGLEQRYAHQLSAGQRQRTVLARALVLSPKILMLDEVMSGQSEFWAARIAELLRGYVDLGGLVLMVSHDPEWVAFYADRVTNLVSSQSDEISAASFFCGFDGSPAEWLEFRRRRAQRKGSVA